MLEGFNHFRKQQLIRQMGSGDNGTTVSILADPAAASHSRFDRGYRDEVSASSL